MSARKHARQTTSAGPRGRVAALERKVEELTARLEDQARELARLRRASAAREPRPIALRRKEPASLRARSKPEDGAVRCPGCTLPATDAKERCSWCGFLFSVLPPSRRPVRAAAKTSPGKRDAGRTTAARATPRRPAPKPGTRLAARATSVAEPSGAGRAAGRAPVRRRKSHSP